MTINENQISRHYLKLKKQIDKNMKRGDMEAACYFLNGAAFLARHAGICFTDEEMENQISDLAARILDGYSFNNIRNIKSVFFIDWICMDVRGLGYIYLKALIDNGYFINYCVPKSRFKNIPYIIDLLNNYENSKIHYIDDSTIINSIKNTADILQGTDSKTLIANVGDTDILSCIVMKACEDSVRRFRISYGDHAFLLGAKHFDYIIEFRDFGITVSKEKKNIPPEKIIKLPFYPCIVSDAEFQGLPFSLEGKKMFVSGGHIYKTIDKNHTFYKNVQEILEKTSNTIFLMLSDSTCAELEKLILKYPGRVYYQKERKDLSSVLKKSAFYLSTYPMSGGLMSQFAAVNGKIPLTLIDKFNMQTGFLLNPQKINAVFNDPDSLIAEAIKLLTDDEYRTNCEKNLSDQVIGKEEFAKQVNKIITEQKSDYQAKAFDVDYEELSRLNSSKRYFKEYCKLFAWGRPKKNFKYVLRVLPFFAFCGGLFWAIGRLERKIFAK